MKFDAYALKGRILPAIFSMILPIFIFNHFYTSEEFSKFVGDIMGLRIVSNLTISAICLFFLSELGRMIGKHGFERWYFKEELHMPTTNFLMFDDSTYSEQHKLKIRAKVQSDFDIYLPTAEEEVASSSQARTRISEAMALIRKKLHGNKFLLQHNIEYGAMRNVIGGSVVGIVLSILNILFFRIIVASELAVILSIATLFIYTAILFLSKVIIDFYGANYAKILFREYLTG